MKFDGIKIGDKVMVESIVEYGWGVYRSFWIPVKVKRVTKTQFVTSDDSRWNKDGKGIGDKKYSHVTFLGEKTWQGKVVDQTEERNVFIKTLKLERKIKAKLDSITVEYGSNIDLNTLSDVLDDVIKIKSILDKQDTF